MQEDEPLKILAEQPHRWFWATDIFKDNNQSTTYKKLKVIRKMNWAHYEKRIHPTLGKELYIYKHKEDKKDTKDTK